MEMLLSQVQLLLVVLFSSVLLVQVSGAPRRDMLTETLRADLAGDKVSHSHSVFHPAQTVAEMRECSARGGDIMINSLFLL